MTMLAQKVLELEYQAAIDLGHAPILIKWNHEKNEPEEHPANWQNYDVAPFQPGYDAMAVRPNENFTFIDIDTKNTSTSSADDLRTHILITLEERLPRAIYQKLFIERSRNGGLHVFINYPAPERKRIIATSATGAELIALYRRNSLCYTYPTPNVVVEYGSREEMERLEDDELETLCSLLAECDEAKKPVKFAEPAQRFNRPPHWQLFDRKIAVETFCHILATIGLERCDTQPHFRKGVVPYEAWRRKDSTSKAISIKVYFGMEPKALFFTSSLPQFPSYHTHSRTGDWSLTASMLIFYHNEQDMDTTEAIITQIADDLDIDLSYHVTPSGAIIQKDTFWEETKTGYKLIPEMVVDLLNQAGYQRHNDGVVRVQDNIVEHVEISDIMLFLADVAKATGYDIHNYVLSSVKRLLNTAVIIEALPKFDATRILRDDSKTVWRFFRNCAVRITNNTATPVSYNDIQGMIWRNHIIDRDFAHTDYNTCMALDFTAKLAGENRCDILMAIIGYNCSRYNDPDNPRLTLILEDIDEDEEGASHGGSGKSLLTQFPKYACGNQVWLDGKNRNTLYGDFAWQRVDSDTRTILVDDADKRFKLEPLFAITTGEFAINRKGKAEFTIPFEDKAKVIITSNYALGEADMSTERRLYIFSVQKVFNLNHRPIHVYKVRFFYEWSDQEWLRFDNFINRCIMLYLNGTLDNMEADPRTTRRRLIHNTDPEFIQFMDGQLANNFFDWCPNQFKTHRSETAEGTVIANAVNVEAWSRSSGTGNDAIKMPKTQLLQTIQSFGIRGLSMKTLTKWVAEWAANRGVGMDMDYMMRVPKQYTSWTDSSGGDFVRCYRITSLPAKLGVRHGSKAENDANPPF